MPNRMNRWIKEKFKQLKIEFGNECSKCGKKEPEVKLEFAHVKETKLKGIGRGRKERYYDIIKHPDCYSLMCKQCHAIYDSRRRT